MPTEATACNLDMGCPMEGWLHNTNEQDTRACTRPLPLLPLLRRSSSSHSAEPLLRHHSLTRAVIFVSTPARHEKRNLYLATKAVCNARTLHLLAIVAARPISSSSV